MSISRLIPAELRLTIDVKNLLYSDTSELVSSPLSWIGQEREHAAATFGLSMEQADYNLFVIGEVGSGRSSLLKHAMLEAAMHRAVPPDLCYLHNFDVPEHPLALRLPAGQGRALRQLMLQLSKILQTEIPICFDRQGFKAESARIQQEYKNHESLAYADLAAYAEAHHFVLHRESGHLVFTLMNEKRVAITEPEVLALSKEQRAKIDQDEQALSSEITCFLEKTRPVERAMKESLTALRRQLVTPLIEHELQEIRARFQKKNKDEIKLAAYLDALLSDVLDNLDLFISSDVDEEARLDALSQILTCYRVNLVVDNAALLGAPVIVEDNPLFRSLFGSIEYRSENDVLETDFSRIRSGSLLRAHGGFLLLHLRDLLADPLVWEKLRRFLRSGRLQIEEPGTAFAPIAAVCLEPEAVEVEVKIILIATREQYYEMQEADPEFACRFRVKVDFAESFLSNTETQQAFAIFVAHRCHDLSLPHFSASAVAALLEEAHREADDQSRQSAIFSHTEALLMESAAHARTRQGKLVEAQDVKAARLARMRRHDYPEQRMQQAILEGEVLITVQGARIGQINGLTVIDQGDCRYGYPVRITALTFAGNDGLINIEREVEMSGPIHDKGVFILQNYLSALFSPIAPLALNASLVFEQEYFGVEGDSASCAELFVLLSALSGLPVKQGIAVTGSLNQHGEVLPIGGVNEKIEGYFRLCQAVGLDGHQGVLIPARNRRHLMLDAGIIAAVEQGVFHIYTAENVSDAIALLMDLPAGKQDAEGEYPHGSVLGRVQRTLQSYRRACLASEHPKPTRKLLR